MFLRKSFNKKASRTYLIIVHGYRDQFGKSKSKTIKSIGYLDELKKHPDPIAYFTQIAKEMDQDISESNTFLVFWIINILRYPSIAFLSNFSSSPSTYFSELISCLIFL